MLPGLARLRRSLAMSTNSATATYIKILSQPKLSAKPRTAKDIQDGIRKLRRLILVEGIPEEVRLHSFVA